MLFSCDFYSTAKLLNSSEPSKRNSGPLNRVRWTPFCLWKLNGEESLVHIEFQTSDSTETPMPRRMAGYIGRLIEQYGMPIYAFVIYLRPNAGAGDPGQYLQECPGHRILIEYTVVRLSELDVLPSLKALGFLRAFSR